jgi:hypothetical protein
MDLRILTDHEMTLDAEVLRFLDSPSAIIVVPDRLAVSGWFARGWTADILASLSSADLPHGLTRF